MSRASILCKLPDGELEVLRHEMRRKALTDLQIARKAEAILGESLGDDKAAASIVFRYRQSAQYAAWLERWLGQDQALKRELEGQRQRFELLRDLVGNPDGDGMAKLSNALLARLLAVGAEMSDEALAEAAAKGGWLKGVVQAVQTDQKARERERLQGAAEKAMEKAGVGAGDREAIRSIFRGEGAA